MTETGDDYLEHPVDIYVMGVLVRRTTWKVHKNSLVGSLAAGQYTAALSKAQAMQQDIDAILAGQEEL